MNDDKRFFEWVGTGLALVIVLTVLWMLAGCKTRYVSVPEYHKEYINRTDTFIHNDVMRDTSWMTIREVDSAELVRLGVRIKGLTNALLIERYNNREQRSNNQRVKTDTIIKTDSVLVPYPVEKTLTKWQRMKMDYGGMAMGGTAVALVLVVVWLARKFRKV